VDVESVTWAACVEVNLAPVGCSTGSAVVALTGGTAVVERMCKPNVDIFVVKLDVGCKVMLTTVEGLTDSVRATPAVDNVDDV